MRYLGNKTKLLTEINKIIRSKVEPGSTIIDLFSGSGSVSDSLKSDYKIIANDYLYFSKCVLSNKLTNIDKNTINKEIKALQNIKGKVGYITRNFSPFKESKRMYFTIENAMKLDSVIDYAYTKEIQLREILIGVIIESISKIANIPGVYGAYLKKWDPRALKNIVFNINEDRIKNSGENFVYNDDANELIKHLNGDLLYLDPPYTKNDYSTQYHLLETIAKNDKPIVTGITGTRPNKVRSKYSQKIAAETSLADLIMNAKQKHIVLSYSSQGLMSYNYIYNLLKIFSVGKPYVKKISHRNYTNKKSTRNDLIEYIFYIEKRKNPIYMSPLNYIGNKVSLIEEIRRKLPKDIASFYDVFGGGLNVGANIIGAKEIIYNDIDKFVCSFLTALRDNEVNTSIKEIEKTIKKYNLLKGSKEEYNKIRFSFNESEDFNWIKFYVMIIYSFNQQIRFNKDHKFNNTVGQSGWSESLKAKFITFAQRIKKINLTILNEDYSNLLNNNYFPKKKNDFIYLDPPYLITTGAYNDGRRGFGGWGLSQEKLLYKQLDNTNNMFMVSNVIDHNGKKNILLEDWSKKYNVFSIKDTKRKELIVVNYEKK